MKKLIADDHKDFPSIRAWCDHYMDQIDKETCVEFRDINHVNVRVYVSNFAKNRRMGLKTKTEKGGILVWLPDVDSMLIPGVAREVDPNRQIVAVYRNGKHPDARIFAGETMTAFCRRVLAKLERFDRVLISGDDAASIRGAVYRASPRRFHETHEVRDGVVVTYARNR